MAKETAKKKDEEEKATDEKEEGGAEGEEGAEGAEGAAPKKKSKKKLLIILLLLLVVLAVAGGGAYYFLIGKPADKAESVTGDGKNGGSVFYTMPEFLVNLNTGGKQTSFLKMTVVLELARQTDVISVEASLPRLFDALNTYLRELRSSDLAGSAGIQRLREELLLRTNQTLAPTKVNDILFKEIVVQ